MNFMKSCFIVFISICSLSIPLISQEATETLTTQHAYTFIMKHNLKVLVFWEYKRPRSRLKEEERLWSSSEEMIDSLNQKIAESIKSVIKELSKTHKVTFGKLQGTIQETFEDLVIIKLNERKLYEFVRLDRVHFFPIHNNSCEAPWAYAQGILSG